MAALCLLIGGWITMAVGLIVFLVASVIGHVVRVGWALCAVLLIISLLSGCVSMDRSEYAYQALHAVDTLQTYQVSQSRCGRSEQDPVTRTLIGRHPDAGGVIAWAVGVGYGHAWFSDYLTRHDAAPWVRSMWNMTTIGVTTATVIENNANGIGLTGERCSN